MHQSEIQGADPGVGTDRRLLTLPVVAVLTTAILLSLMGFQLALQLPGGQGIEDVLGWTRAESVRKALAYWRQPLAYEVSGLLAVRPHFEALYLMVDTGLFMPFYAVLLLLLAQALQDMVLRDFLFRQASPLGAWMQRWTMVAAGGLVGALLLVDAVENLGGAARIGLTTPLFAGGLAAGAVLGVGLWLAATHDDAGVRRRAWQAIALAAAAGGLVALAGTFGAPAEGACHGDVKECAKLGAQAHSFKPKLAMAALGLTALGWLVWLFGADLIQDHLVAEDAPSLRVHRARLRSGLASIVWRTRYVVLLLALFAGLTLGLDQCRDVLLALAYWSTGDAPGAPGRHRLGMILMVGLSVGLFVYSTWLWARLACRISSQADVLATGPSAKGDGPNWAEQLQQRLGVFARSWVRALSLVPLVCMYALVAFAISDAINAAAALPAGGPRAQSLVLTVLTLVAIGAVTVGLGAVFLLMRRVLSLPNDADYYNRAAGLYQLLQGKDEAALPLQPSANGTVGGWLWAMFWGLVRRLHQATTWLTPRTLPPLALLLVLLVRLGLAWTPETMSAIPAALALVALTLSWWMGVAGVLTLAEVRLGRPYGLILIAVLGLLAMLPLGLGDNHVLPFAGLPAGKDVLDEVRMQGLAVAAALSAVAIGLWWLFTTDLPLEAWMRSWLVRLARRPTPRHQACGRIGRWALDRGALQPALRLGALVLGVALAMLTLRVADRVLPTSADTTAVRDGKTEQAKVKTVDQAVQAWLGQLGTARPGPVYLVASEGGGIRSAYWTALVLATLRRTLDDFDRRTLALSGVSGGALGMAVYSACIRRAAGPEAPPVAVGAGVNVVAGQGDDDPVQACIKQTFAALDPLSPLLGAWLFEDALARLLPVPMATDSARPGWRCIHPACGHLSRALGFEREWLRARPELAQPVSAVGRPGGGWQPQLLLNSTWVESGELASVSSLVIEPAQFPAARDVQGRLGRELSLIGGAHVAARFPFINPLAALQTASAASGAPARATAAASGPPVGEVEGHLADGGYFDNSATLALTSLWRRVLLQQRQGELRRDVEVVVIRNGQKPASCDRPAPQGPDPDCIVPPRVSMPLPQTLAEPTRRRSWSLYADLLGPAVTVLNVSGIGAHGRHAPAMLWDEAVQAGQAAAPAASAATGAAAASAAPAASAASAVASITCIRLVDQLAIGTLVPLGWYLSPTARAALNQEASQLPAAWGPTTSDLPDARAVKRRSSGHRAPPEAGAECRQR